MAEYTLIGLAKANKLKNRLAGRMAKVQTDVQCYNSVLASQRDKVDVRKAMELRDEIMQNLNISGLRYYGPANYSKEQLLLIKGVLGSALGLEFINVNVAIVESKPTKRTIGLQNYYPTIHTYGKNQTLFVQFPYTYFFVFLPKSNFSRITWVHSKTRKENLEGPWELIRPIDGDNIPCLRCLGELPNMTEWSDEKKVRTMIDLFWNAPFFRSPARKFLDFDSWKEKGVESVMVQVRSSILLPKVELLP